MDCENDTEDSIRQNLKKNVKRISNGSNSDYIAHVVVSGDFSMNFENFVKAYIHRIPDLPFLITCTRGERLECIQTEQYEKFYKGDRKIVSFLRNPYGGPARQIFTAKRDIYESIDPSEHQFLQVYKSFGDDIDDFYYRIKMNEVNRINKIILQYSQKEKYEECVIRVVYDSLEHPMPKLRPKFGPNDHLEDTRSFIRPKVIRQRTRFNRRITIRPNWEISVILTFIKNLKLFQSEYSSHARFGTNDSTVKTFHLSMLSEAEEREMYSRVADFYRNTEYKIFDNFKTETALSKKLQNYALSLCARKTYYCELNEVGEPTLWDIHESDPWQEKIKKNFQELKSAKRRRFQNEVPLFNYWELDSDSD